MKRMLMAFALALLPKQGGAPNASDSDQDPPSRAARVAYISGPVSFQASGAEEWSLATLNYSVTSGDRLFADAGARAELDLGSLVARLSENTDVTLSTLDDHYAQFAVSQGVLRVSVTQLAAGDSVEIATPNAAIAVLSSAKVRVDVLPPDGATTVRVDDGTVDIAGNGASGRFRGPATVRLTGTSPVQIADAAMVPPDAFDRFSEDRDRAKADATSYRYVSRDMPGGADLDRYGRWETDAAYGPIWYPIAVPLGWMPYHVGRWAWVEPWGWVWVDEAPWGFAPFHYGRWVRVRSIWGWVPGPIVPRPWYSPALVVWVDGESFGAGMAAWLPLGPREPFIPWYHHSPRYLREINVTNVRNVTDAERFVHASEITHVNRGAGMTVVSSASFRSAEPVGSHAIRANADAVIRAPTIPHPPVMPDARAAIGGRAVAAPRRAPPRRPEQPLNFAPRSGALPGAPAAAPSEHVLAGAARAAAATATKREPSPLVVRRAPVPTNPPFPARRDAMQPHPGRPLEPQQIRNLRDGKPAGSMRDHEEPPHPARGGAKPPTPPPKRPG